MAALRDLELLIQSRYPIIAIETLEDVRLDSVVAEVATSLRVPLWVWTVTIGLKRAGTPSALYDSQQPLKALGNIAALTGDGLYLMKDLHRFLDRPEVVRKVQDLAPLFTTDRRAIVISGSRLDLPAEIQALAGFFALGLPGPAELRAVVQRTLAELGHERPVRMTLSPAELDELLERMRGFTEFEAARAVTKAVLRDGGLARQDIELMVELKKELLHKDGLLEYVAPEENLAEVGGFATLKAWLAKRARAFEPAAREFGIQTPKGILLLGVQGCLRGDTRVLLADGRMPTIEALAREASDCLVPGTYEVAHRVAVEDGGTALASLLQIHANVETVLVTFADGRELEATPDHEVLTPGGWRRVDRLVAGDAVRLWERSQDFFTPPRRTGFGRPLHSIRKRRVPVDTLPDIWTPDLAELIGLIAAEGNRDRYRVTLTLSEDEDELAQWLRERSEKLFGILPAERSRHPKRVRQFRFDSFDVAVNLHPLIEGTHRTKAVPDSLFWLDDTCVAGFLRALFEGDGTVVNHRRGSEGRRAPRVELKTVSPSMAKGVLLLLQRLGIHASVHTQVETYGYSRYSIHTVQVRSRTSLERFRTIVGFISSKKSARLSSGLATMKRWTRPRHTTAARVVSISTGRHLDRVYDLTVPGAERFVANGLIVHNCGKTLVARAVAREWRLPLLKLEAGRLYDKFIGESEKNLERVLRTAEQMAPCVLMIDEIEKGLAWSASSESDAGLSKRIFGRLLGWLQDRKAPVFVVATCNNISLLPPEMTRKGRFDEIFFVDLPTPAERQGIFAVHLKKRKRDPAAFDLDALVGVSEGFSGAEIEQAVVSALYTAFSRSTELTTAIILEELRATKPLSVTRREEIDALRAWAHDRTVSAS